MSLRSDTVRRDGWIPGALWIGRGDRLAAATTVAVVFAADCLAPFGGAFAVLYVVAILLAAEPGRKAPVMVASAVSALLALTVFLSVHLPDMAPEALFHLLCSLAANALATGLLLRRADDHATLSAELRLLEAASDAVILSDRAGRVLSWSRGAERLYGWSAAEAIGRPVAELRPEVVPAGEPATPLRGGRAAEMTVRGRTGELRVIACRWSVADHGNGDIRRLEAAVDITRHRAAEAARAEATSGAILETLGVAVIEHDLRPVKAALDALPAAGAAGLQRLFAERPALVGELKAKVRVTGANARARRMLGLDGAAPAGAGMEALLPDADRSFADFLLALHAGAPVFETETVMKGRDGRQLPVLVAMTLPPEGGLDRVQVSLVDLTDRQQDRDALDLSRRELEQASRVAVIGEISASIAHEVNQPLSAILTFQQAALRWLNRNPPDLGEARLALADAIASTDQASAVVHRVRMLFGKARADHAPVSLDALIVEAIHLKLDEFQSGNVSSVLDLAHDGSVVNGDRILLQQVLLNVISNALQAMRETPVNRRVLVIATRTEGGTSVVRILDRGHGLGGAAGDRLFRPFVTTRTDGMGLGLALCRSIMIAHGGTIALRDRGDGAGAEVEIRLPAAAAAEGLPGAPVSPAG